MLANRARRSDLHAGKNFISPCKGRVNGIKTDKEGSVERCTVSNRSSGWSSSVDVSSMKTGSAIGMNQSLASATPYQSKRMSNLLAATGEVMQPEVDALT
jgi:hypothetical protein